VTEPPADPWEGIDAIQQSIPRQVPQKKKKK
jgi:hypothetical protein